MSIGLVLLGVGFRVFFLHAMELRKRERESERAHTRKKEKGWKFERGRVKLRIGSVRVYVIPNKGQLDRTLSLSAKITG
jgi:hypothetical protein